MCIAECVIGLIVLALGEYCSVDFVLENLKLPIHLNSRVGEVARLAILNVMRYLWHTLIFLLGNINHWKLPTLMKIKIDEHIKCQLILLICLFRCIFVIRVCFCILNVWGNINIYNTPLLRVSLLPLCVCCDGLFPASSTMAVCSCVNFIASLAHFFIL